MNFLKKYPKHKLMLLFVDFVLIHASFAFSLKARFLGNVDLIDFSTYSISREWVRFIPYSFLMLFYFQYKNFYKFHNIVSANAHVNLIFPTLIKSVLGFVVYQLVLMDVIIDSRVYYFYFACILCTLFIPIRVFIVGLVRKIPVLRDNIAIIGADQRARELARTFSDKSNLYNVVGFVDSRTDVKEIDSVPILGPVEKAAEMAEKHNIQSFILASDDMSRRKFFDIFNEFAKMGLVLAVSSDYMKVLHEKHDGLDIYHEFKLVRFCFNDDHRFLRVVKRIYDVVLSCIAIVLLSPVLLVIALLVKLSSPGPIFYTHTRIGENGRPFKFYKFRSMYVGSDKDEGRNKTIEDFIKGETVGENAGSTKVVNRKNITPVGNFLRKHSLDELPQLFNVLLGDMSLVGARPCLSNEWNAYEDWQKYRHTTKPGCTGVWQVHGRSEVNFEESVLLDIYYNQNFTPWWDVKLILQTIPVLFFGRGGE